MHWWSSEARHKRSVYGSWEGCSQAASTRHAARGERPNPRCSGWQTVSIRVRTSASRPRGMRRGAGIGSTRHRASASPTLTRQDGTRFRENIAIDTRFYMTMTVTRTRWGAAARAPYALRKVSARRWQNIHILHLNQDLQVVNNWK